MKKLNAYAVFEGGGAKGVAYAGALAAARRNGINFVGYGGASAGALVAFLSSIGMTPVEMYRFMKANPIATYLNDGNARELKALAELFGDLSLIKGAGFWGFWFLLLMGCVFFGNYLILCVLIFLFLLIFVCCNFKGLFAIYKVYKYKGIYDFGALEDKLIYEVKNRLGFVDRNFTFRDLYEKRPILLKVIASSLNSGKVEVFCKDTTPDVFVLDAVLASCGYPFVFKPREIDGKMLVDGGLASNMPVFLFHRSYSRDIPDVCPVFAFDLVAKSAQKNLDSIGFFAKAMLDTALDASDAVIFKIVGARRVMVPIPDGLETLDFLPSEQMIQRTHIDAYLSTRHKFENDPIVRLFKEASLEIGFIQAAKKMCHPVASIDLYVQSICVDIKKVYNPIGAVRGWVYVQSLRGTLVSVSSINAKGYEYSLQGPEDCVRAHVEKSFFATLVGRRVRLSFPLKDGWGVVVGVLVFSFYPRDDLSVLDNSEVDDYFFGNEVFLDAIDYKIIAIMKLLRNNMEDYMYGGELDYEC